MPSKFSASSKFDVPSIIDGRSSDLRIMHDDWFSFGMFDQLRHEAMVRDYVLKQNLQEVEVNRRVHKINKDSFGIKLNFSEIYGSCLLCP